ncbi:MAG: arylsulfotransferase family protein [Alphaproteobacteria bacterium]|nr:arylsulfotransferase family protein [Alphaproteobacteria bacterium]
MRKAAQTTPNASSRLTVGRSVIFCAQLSFGVNDGREKFGGMKRSMVLSLALLAVCFVGFVGFAFSFGIYHGAKRTGIMWATVDFKDTIEDAVKSFTGEGPTPFGIRAEYHLKPALYEGDGVTVNEVNEEEPSLIVLAGYFDGKLEMRLIRRDGTVVASWALRSSKFVRDASGPWTTVQGILALPDGSVVFNFNDSGTVKLDKCGDVVWTLVHPVHHSLTRAEEGGFWSPGNRFFKKGEASPLPLFETPFSMNTVLRISEDGKVLSEMSVPKLIFDNRLGAILTVGREFSDRRQGKMREIIHLNKIAELTSDIAGDFPMFEVGDLALSLENHNMIVVVDPDTWKVKWWRIGPWLRQHDPEFRRGGRLVVFNNNNYPTLEGTEASNKLSSNVVEIDPATDQYSIVFGSRKGQEMSAPQRSSIELTPNGGILINESPRGRVLEVDAEGRIVWEYINRAGPDLIEIIFDIGIYPASYFAVSDWSCAQAGG